MVPYIKSEVYRLIRYKWIYVFIIICSGLLLSSNIILAAVKYADSSFIWANTYFSFSNVYNSMVMVYILCIMVSNMIFGNEHTNHTMKNSISYGISRGTIYFGKLLVQMVYSLIAFTIIIGVHVISAYLLLEHSGTSELIMLIRSCTACTPLLLFGLAASNCFVFNIEGSGAVAASSGLMIVLPLVSNMLGMRFRMFAELSKILPWNIMNYSSYDPALKQLFMYWSTNSGYLKCWIYGMIQMAVIAVIGYFWFRKKEIK
ncbi:ABC transporter permease [Anaerocolumna sp. MB42-C2]|uniref:ABC transporter permease n=1 Tax=Anaerocolumna sp. MB42-C2 TaxID=3070997 RepID=UPI0027DF71A2|nr:ABC transporter permease [Anaerocolumna sp. MB42-C2]WMJ87949.1 ABC transporter permease [Anaerocolumna sp. MB42-C2]